MCPTSLCIMGKFNIVVQSDCRIKFYLQANNVFMLQCLTQKNRKINLIRMKYVRKGNTKRHDWKTIWLRGIYIDYD